MWARHHLALDDGRDIHIPAVVVSQAWRDSRRQVRLGKFLTGCHVEPVRLETAKAAGILCGRARTSDVVDATVVVMAASLGAIIWTSDPDGSARSTPKTSSPPPSSAPSETHDEAASRGLSAPHHPQRLQALPACEPDGVGRAQPPATRHLQERQSASLDDHAGSFDCP